MPRPRKDGVSTRRRLLDAACALFAEHGFRGTTVAMICRLAGTNVAAVNYHFRDKEALYREAVRHAFGLATARYPVDGGLPPEAPPEQRLHAYVEAQLRRTFSQDSAAYFPRLFVMEMAEPTGVVGETLREVLRPHREHLRGVLRQLLGGAVGEDQARLCVVSIISQCYFFAFNRALRERHFGVGGVDERRLREMIEHITQFCLAGIRDARTRCEAGAVTERRDRHSS
jgi:AcrR family transcriptional regulator